VFVNPDQRLATKLHRFTLTLVALAAFEIPAAFLTSAAHIISVIEGAISIAEPKHLSGARIYQFLLRHGALSTAGLGPHLP
jgi:hypothetical protein